MILVCECINCCICSLYFIQYILQRWSARRRSQSFCPWHRLYVCRRYGFHSSSFLHSFQRPIWADEETIDSIDDYNIIVHEDHHATSWTQRSFALVVFGGTRGTGPWPPIQSRLVLLGDDWRYLKMPHFQYLIEDIEDIWRLGWTVFHMLPSPLSRPWLARCWTCA